MFFMENLHLRKLSTIYILLQ